MGASAAILFHHRLYRLNPLLRSSPVYAATASKEAHSGHINRRRRIGELTCCAFGCGNSYISAYSCLSSLKQAVDMMHITTPSVRVLIIYAYRVATKIMSILLPR